MNNASGTLADTTLQRELDAECARQVFEPEKAQAWQHGMLDPARGERIWEYLAPYLPAQPRILDLGCCYGAASAGLCKHADDIWALDIRFGRANFSLCPKKPL